MLIRSSKALRAPVSASTGGPTVHGFSGAGGPAGGGDVAICFGTRPEAIKLAPLVRALQRHGRLKPVTFFSGQHPGAELLFEQLGARVDHRLEPTPHDGDLNTLLSQLVAVMGQALDDWIVDSGQKPTLVLVHGDTTTSLASALSAFHLGLPVGHVEAGLRTFNLASPFPEELNRQLITKIATYHFAPTHTNKDALVAEGVGPDRIAVTGNTGIDQLLDTAALDHPVSEPHVEEFMVKGDPVIVATAHRRENWGQGLRNIARATARIADLHPRARIVFPLHPNPQVQETLKQEIAARPNVLLTGPLDYQDFTAVLKRAAVVITDSGGIQEEAPSLGAHVFVTRDETERIEGAEAGVLTIVGTDVGNIVWAVSQYLASSIRHSELVNPYGDGRSAARIIDFLDRRLTAHSNSEGVEVVPARPSAAGTVQG